MKVGDNIVVYTPDDVEVTISLRRATTRDVDRYKKQDAKTLEVLYFDTILPCSAVERKALLAVMERVDFYLGKRDDIVSLLIDAERKRKACGETNET